jgi:CubicO group peptidase (beta-lactamase class C family)
MNAKLKFAEFTKNKCYVINTTDNEKLDGNSEFLIGSITKLFTMLSILILQQHKLLNINDKVSKYIKSNIHNDFSKITISDLIHHKSGLVHIESRGIKTFPDFKMFETNNSLQVITKLMKYKLIIHKKEEFNYSDYGYILLGAIMEITTGLTYLEVYKKYIFKPLKMNNTSVGNTNITLYNFNGQKLTKQEILERYTITTAGSLYSTINDFIKFSNGIVLLLNTNSLKILQTTYLYQFDLFDNTHMIVSSGEIFGGLSQLWIKFDKNWKKNKILLIKFMTSGNGVFDFYFRS